MRIAATLHSFGLLLLFFSVVFIPSLLLGLVEGPGLTAAMPFISALLLTSGCGIAIAAGVMAREYWRSEDRAAYLKSSRSDRTRQLWESLGRHEGFLLTALFWCGLSVFGALPFLLAPETPLSFVAAVFESVSGLTTTGATVLTGLDDLPRSILLYRQLLQWIGGIGLVLIAIAIMPILGIGGMQLYRVEAPGPFKGAHLRPRLVESVRLLVMLYSMLTALCALCYFAAGMSLFDAVCHSLTTVAIGGFSTHDSSFGYFAGMPAVLVVATFFMVVSSISFTLHFQLLQHPGRKSLKRYWRDPECQFFLSHLTIIVAICVTALAIFSTPATGSILQGVFQAVSIATTTGYVTTPFAVWPAFLPFILFSFAFVGGCTGSTAGGLKAVRVLLVIAEGLRELRHLVHPRAIIPVKLGKRVLSDRVMRAVWSFMGMYVLSYVVLVMILLVLGLDYVTAFYAVAATLNNIGPGLGEVSDNYSDLSAAISWVLCFSMLLGRLELMSLLVLFTPAFWRK